MFDRVLGNVMNFSSREECRFEEVSGRQSNNVAGGCKVDTAVIGNSMGIINRVGACETVSACALHQIVVDCKCLRV